MIGLYFNTMIRIYQIFETITRFMKLIVSILVLLRFYLVVNNNHTRNVKQNSW